MSETAAVNPVAETSSSSLACSSDGSSLGCCGCCCTLGERLVRRALLTCCCCQACSKGVPLQEWLVAVALRLALPDCHDLQCAAQLRVFYQRSMGY